MDEMIQRIQQEKGWTDTTLLIVLRQMLDEMVRFETDFFSSIRHPSHIRQDVEEYLKSR